MLGPDDAAALDGLRNALRRARCPSGRRRCRAPPERFRAAAHCRPAAERIVYFPSCAARNMGAQRGDDEVRRCPSSRSGCSPRRASTSSTRSVSTSCAAASRSRARACSTPPTASRRSSKRRCAKRRDDGRLPIVFDTSPCAYRMKRFLAGRLPVQDSIEFIHDAVLPRVDVAAIDARWRSTRCAACARWASSTSSPRSRRAAAREVVHGRRRAVLRLRRRQGLQPAGAQRARAAPPEGGAAVAMCARATRRAAPARSGCRSMRAFPTVRSSASSTPAPRPPARSAR